jgi:hypothetical protein
MYIRVFPLQLVLIQRPKSADAGGAAITNKGELESIDEGSLRSACAQLRQAMSEADDASAPEKKVMGMDWSRRPGDPADPVVDTEGFAGMAGLGIDTNFIVVHGAGMCNSESVLPLGCGFLAFCLLMS